MKKAHLEYFKYAPNIFGEMPQVDSKIFVASMQNVYHVLQFNGYMLFFQ